MSAPLTRLAYVVATAFGAGYSPVAPGTAGSLVGLLLYWPLSRLSPWLALGVTAIVLAAGVLAAERVATASGVSDPGLVVVDEVVGQWLSLLFLPFSWTTAVAGFLLFRALDIVKPWPARDLERLHGGVGIMADDVMAGIYANLLLRVLGLVVPLA